MLATENLTLESPDSPAKVRATDCILRQVDAQDVARRDQASEAAGKRSSATAEVDKTHAQAKMWHHKRRVTLNTSLIEQVSCCDVTGVDVVGARSRR
jgi:hypothetical protein